MLKTSTAVTGAAKGRHPYSKGSDLFDKRARLLKLQALSERRSKLLSEVSAINGEMSALQTKIAEDLATFRR
jgi:hypothetical protein